MFGKPKSHNNSLLLAISWQGIEGFIICKGGVSGEIFTRFIMQLINKYKGTMYYDKMVFMMDNAKVHSVKKIQNINE